MGLCLCARVHMSVHLGGSRYKPGLEQPGRDWDVCLTFVTLIVVGSEGQKHSEDNYWRCTRAQGGTYRNKHGVNWNSCHVPGLPGVQPPSITRHPPGFMKCLYTWTGFVSSHVFKGLHHNICGCFHWTVFHSESYMHAEVILMYIWFFLSEMDDRVGPKVLHQWRRCRQRARVHGMTIVTFAILLLSIPYLVPSSYLAGRGVFWGVLITQSPSPFTHTSTRSTCTVVITNCT